MKQGLLEIAARMAHEVNRLWCAEIGDDTPLPWAETEDWHKESVLNGVQFLINNPDKTPADQHQNWMDVKVAEGWVYGEEKNPNANPPAHPCLVDYKSLPATQQVKDALFRGVVLAVLNGAPDKSAEKSEMVTKIKDAANSLTSVIGEMPASRRRSVALTHLETAIMFAEKAALYGDGDERID